MWLELTKEGRDAVIEREIQEWASEGDRGRGASAQFLACMAGRTRAERYRVTDACRSQLRSVQAPAALGRVVIEAGRICAGIDMV